MLTKDTVVKFIKIYFVFILFALIVNLSLEVLIPTSEQKDIRGIIFFYILFSFVGSAIFFHKNYRPLKMGILPLIIGFILEFIFMKPDWVRNIYALEVNPGIILTVIISSIYWFTAWAIPSYALHKYFIKE